MKPNLENRNFVVRQVRLCLALGAAVFMVSTASAQTNYSLNWWTPGAVVARARAGFSL